MNACVRLCILAALAALAYADLRQASQPRNQWKIIRSGTVPFVVNASRNLYMEPRCAPSRPPAGWRARPLTVPVAPQRLPV